MSAFYITELKASPNKRSKSFDKDSSDSQGGSQLNHKRSSSLITGEKSKKFANSKKDFLEYLIQEETKFADLDKIAGFYKNLVVETLNSFNRNETLINKKREQLKHIEMTIQQSLLTAYKIKEEDLITLYNKQINELKEKIMVKEHDLECYQNMHQRVYKANYLLNERHNSELKFAMINDQQLNKYHIIKNNAFVKVKKQKIFLDNMRNFNGISLNKFESNVEQKKKKFNELEFQVFTIKSDTVIIENKINEIKQEILKVNKKIKDYNVKHLERSKNHTQNLRSFLKSKIKLLQIYKSLKVNSLQDIINKFNEESSQYQTLGSQFVHSNKVIADLNMEHTNLKKELDEINVKIDEKIQLATARGNTTDDAIIKIDLTKKELSLINISTNERVMYFDRILKNLLKYMKTYDSKISELKNTLYFAFNIDNRANRVSLKPRESKSLSQEEETIDYDNEIDNIMKADIYDADSIKKLLKFFNRFAFKILNVLSIVCSNVAIDLYSAASKFNSVDLSPSSDNSVMNTTNKKSFDVFFIYKDAVLASLDEYILQAMFRLENKIKILSRTEREIFKDRKPRRDTRSGVVTQKKKTSLESLFSNFTGFLNKNAEKEKIDFLHKSQAHLLSHLNKFTNELVQNEKEEKLNKNNKQKKATFNKQEHLAKMKVSKSSTRSEKTTDFQESILKNDYLEDSYISTKVYKDHEEDEHLNFGNQKNNREMVKIYTRINDLRNLDIKYFKLKQNNVVNNEDFNEIYFNYKKKYNHIHRDDDRKIKTASNLSKPAEKKTYLKNKTVTNFGTGFKKLKSSKSEMNIIQEPTTKFIHKTTSVAIRKDFLKSFHKEEKLIKDNERIIDSKIKNDFRNSQSSAFYSTAFSNETALTKNMKSSVFLNSGGKTINYLKLPFVTSNDAGRKTNKKASVNY